MRTIKHHIVDGDSVNHQLTITVMDEPGAGGANHSYAIDWPGNRRTVDFQNGPIKEAGVNGVTQEALLAIVMDRLDSFQAGSFACDANQRARYHVGLALDSLQERTKSRIARGVEGQNIK